MRTSCKVSLLAFQVLSVSKEDMDGETRHWDLCVLTKEQLRAAQIVGESSKELIHRIYERNGRRVLAIGKAERAEAEIDLGRLWLDTL